MLVVSWNINSIRGAGNDRLARIISLLQKVDPDLVLLQEVGHPGSLPSRLQEGLGNASLPYFAYSGEAGSNEKRYGCVVASKWPVKRIPTGWAPGVRWPQLLASVVLVTPWGEWDIFVAHIPNGSGNGWHKIATFESLALGLGGSATRPRILGGDFNEPKRVLSSGEIVPFGGIQNADGTFHWEGERFHPKSGDEHPRMRWRNGVLSILGQDVLHGLRHVWFDRHGYSEVTTHVTKNLSGRFFDHLLVSEHFVVVDAGYHDAGWRTDGPSDHSAAWARVELQK